MAMTMIVLVLLAVSGSKAQPKPVDLTELSLEELMNIEVTLGARKAEKISETAAAVFVITSEDIERSGVTSIPEALRMVPGFDVARLDANKWAISARGFNTLFANKLLVLIDGRCVYSPLFSGVFWESQDVFLEDIDRIEVIRGPGAALWGANAVNGIINIITKHAQETQGVLVHVGAGTKERAAGSLRYGGKIGSKVHYRIFGKYFERNPFVYENGERASDGWNALRGGFRVDGNGNPKTGWSVQGERFECNTGQTLSFPIFNIPFYYKYKSHITGGNLLGRFRHAFSEKSDIQFQMVYDQIDRNENILSVGSYHTFDADFQHHVTIGSRHEWIWGAGYRIISDNIESTQLIKFVPPKQSYDLVSAFVQDEISFSQGKYRLTIGSKFEHNDFTGFEIQPNIRMLVKSDPKRSIWWAVSRAVRTPSRAEHDIQVVNMVGNRGYKSEELIAYEFGYRNQPRESFIVDLSFFFNDYHKLQTFEGDTVYNKKSAKAIGAELALVWIPLDWWHIKSAYSFWMMQVYLDPDSREKGAFNVEHESPEDQAYIRSSMDLPLKLDLDVMARAVSPLSTRGMGVDSYAALDACLAWNFSPNVRFEIVGQNLNKKSHLEYRADWIPFANTLIQRSIYGGIRVQF
jgi:iron complex outermembrane receptor protein